MEIEKEAKKVKYRKEIGSVYEIVETFIIRVNSTPAGIRTGSRMV